MICHHVEKYANVALLSFADKVVEVGHGPKLRIDGVVVRYIVTEIDERRRRARRDPNGIHSQTLEVVKARGYALQIAHAVAICILETSRIDFVEYRVLPPRLGSASRALLRMRSDGNNKREDDVAKQTIAHHGGSDSRVDESVLWMGWSSSAPLATTIAMARLNHLATRPGLSPATIECQHEFR